ncbi:MAG: hypothetical protein KGL39_06315 [Patescibacteria group bacterium]|nr:hypothetical protein [Patescibacteria group bacterium]
MASLLTGNAGHFIAGRGSPDQPPVVVRHQTARFMPHRNIVVPVVAMLGECGRGRKNH